MVSIRRIVRVIIVVAGAIFISSPAQADLEFSCTVQRTDDGVKFRAMERSLACPISVQVARDDGSAQATYATSCIIDVKDFSCRGVVEVPAGAMIISVGTAPSLLKDDEVSTGAMPASKDMPVARLSDDKTKATVEHRYIFPVPYNFYHNSERPCDVDKDGKVSPLDMLVLNEFRRRNRWTVNLMKHESNGGSVAAVDVNDDWWADWRDERALLHCLNR